MLLFSLFLSCDKAESDLSSDYNERDYPVESLNQLDSYYESKIAPLDKLSFESFTRFKSDLTFKENRIVGWSMESVVQKLTKDEMKELKSLLIGNKTQFFPDKTSFQQKDLLAISFDCLVYVIPGSRPRPCSFGAGVDCCRPAGLGSECLTWSCP